jgi:hypothetical protein
MVSIWHYTECPHLTALAQAMQASGDKMVNRVQGIHRMKRVVVQKYAWMFNDPLSWVKPWVIDTSKGGYRNVDSPRKQVEVPIR